MPDPFLRDVYGDPCGLSRRGPIPWTPEAQAILATYAATLPARVRRLATDRLRRRAQDAARRQQYPTVSETTLRAQISQLAEMSTEGVTRR